MHQLSRQELIKINGGAYLRGVIVGPSYTLIHAIFKLINKLVK